MNTLICGSFGFIGFNFAIDALNKNKDVILLDSLNNRCSEINFNEINESVHKVKLDINQVDIDFIKKNKITKIINFAAESHVDNSISNPKSFIHSNIVGFENLLRCSIQSEISEFLHISTDEVYGSYLSDFANEEFKLKPSSPYSATKASADLIGLSYRNTYGLDLKIIRPANNYGIYQQPEKLIPFSIISILNGKKIELYGDGKNIRHWLHVDDTVDGVNHVLEFGKGGEIYNIGSGEYLSNIEIAQKILSTLNLEFDDNVDFIEDRPGHDFRYAVDFSKLTDLKWKPKKNVDSEIDKVINWYKDNVDWWSNNYKKTIESRKSRLNIK
jgi:dTDP-glucose 4,6-dehydratase